MHTKKIVKNRKFKKSNKLRNYRSRGGAKSVSATKPKSRTPRKRLSRSRSLSPKRILTSKNSLSKKIVSENSFVISTYNILARGNTHYNWRCHRNIPDITEELDRESAEKYFDFKKNSNGIEIISKWKINTNSESENQTINRYTFVADDIIGSNSDIVCLQECDPSLFDIKFNRRATELNAMYTRYDKLNEIRPKEKQAGGGPAIILKKAHNLKSIYPAIFTEGDYGGTSKGAVILPVVDKKDNAIWVVSGHFNQASLERTRLVSKIEELTILSSHPSGLENISVVVMGDFNLEGNPGKIPRQNLMSYEYYGSEDYDSTTAYPKITNRIKSSWYNKDSHLPIVNKGHAIMTGMTGDFLEHRNIDHVFITNNKFKNSFDIIGERDSIWGPYEEEKSGKFKFIKRIGSGARNSQLTLKHIKDYYSRTKDKGEAKIVRGSDHTMIKVTFEPI